MNRFLMKLGNVKSRIVLLISISCGLLAVLVIIAWQPAKQFATEFILANSIRNSGIMEKVCSIDQSWSLEQFRAITSSSRNATDLSSAIHEVELIKKQADCHTLLSPSVASFKCAIGGVNNNYFCRVSSWKSASQKGDVDSMVTKVAFSKGINQGEWTLSAIGLLSELNTADW